jgi:cobalamin biosynthesis protein CobD/CbiB
VGDSLRAAGLLVLTVAVLAALAAYLLGRPPWLRRSAAWGGRAMASRPGGGEFEAWVAGHANPVRIGAIAVAVLVLFLTGIDWVPVVIVGALLGLLLWGVAVVERGAGEHVEAG